MKHFIRKLRSFLVKGSVVWICIPGRMEERTFVNQVVFANEDDARQYCINSDGKYAYLPEHVW